MDCLYAVCSLPHYRRLSSVGIPCPEPITVNQNVLVMTFIGEEGWPSPRLRDANLVRGVLLFNSLCVKWLSCGSSLAFGHINYCFAFSLTPIYIYDLFVGSPIVDLKKRIESAFPM